MLHLVISTPRSGSNSLCKFLSVRHNAVNLFEPVTDNRGADNELTKPISLIIKDLLSLGSKEDVVAKFHVDHLLMLYPQDINLIVNLLSSAKLYYCLRLTMSEQIKSIKGIKQTGVCDERSNVQNINITGIDALDIISLLTNEISVMGEWYKKLPGEICILEEMSRTYSSYNFSSYGDTYNYTYDSAYTKQFVEQYVDILEIFNRGNPLYKLFGH